jgi:hypothetical protein
LDFARLVIPLADAPGVIFAGVFGYTTTLERNQSGAMSGSVPFCSSQTERLVWTANAFCYSIRPLACLR